AAPGPAHRACPGTPEDGTEPERLGPVPATQPRPEPVHPSLLGAGGKSGLCKSAASLCVDPALLSAFFPRGHRPGLPTPASQARPPGLPTPAAPLPPSPHPRVPHLQGSPAMSTRPIGAAVRQRAARFGIAAAALTLGLTALPGLAPMAQAAVVEPGDLQIQEIYGGGGNAGAVFQNDFVELVNTSEDDLSVDGWTLQ